VLGQQHIQNAAPTQTLFVIIIAATRCHIYYLPLKCTQFDFDWGSDPDPAGELTALPRAVQLDLRGPTSRGREERRTGRRGERERGTGGKGEREWIGGIIVEAASTHSCVRWAGKWLQKTWAFR